MSRLAHTLREDGMKRYTYRGIAALGVACFQLGGVFAICFFTLVIVGSMVMAALADPSAWFAFWFFPLGLVVVWPAGLAMICTFPSSIWLDGKGLVIKVFWRKHIAIPWRDVLEVRHCTFGAPYLVIARRITLAHLVVGWIYGLSDYPGFLIGSGLENRDELVREIKLRIGQFD
jgi:hypothetical protein